MQKTYVRERHLPPSSSTAQDTSLSIIEPLHASPTTYGDTHFPTSRTRVLSLRPNLEKVSRTPPSFPHPHPFPFALLCPVTVRKERWKRVSSDARRWTVLSTWRRSSLQWIRVARGTSQAASWSSSKLRRNRCTNSARTVPGLSSDATSRTDEVRREKPKGVPAGKEETPGKETRG